MSWLSSIQTRSISVLVIQAGGCRGCALQFSRAMSKEGEVKGITITGNPKQADAMLITGCINEKSKEAIQKKYEQMLSPKAVIAVGACSCSGNLFRREESGIYPAEEFLPVDAWIRGCTPDIEGMLEAVVRAIEVSLENEESRESL